MSVRLMAPLAAITVLLVVGIFVPGCAREPGPNYMFAATDDAPIRVKNERLEVELMGKKISDDSWEDDHNGRFHPSKSERQHPDLLIFAIKQDGTWCDNQPYRTDEADIEYGDGTESVETVNIKVTGRKFKVQFKKHAPGGVGTKILYYQGGSGDFLYRVKSKDGKFDCAADKNNPMYVNIFEVN